MTIDSQGGSARTSGPLLVRLLAALPQLLGRSVVVGLALTVFVCYGLQLVSAAAGDASVLEQPGWEMSASFLLVALVERLLRLGVARTLPARLTGWGRFVRECAGSVLALTVAIVCPMFLAVIFITPRPDLSGFGWLLGVVSLAALFLFGTTLMVDGWVAWPAHRLRAAGVGSACVAVGFLSFYVQEQSRVPLVQRLSRLEDEIRKLEGVAAQHSEFWKRIAETESRLASLRFAIPESNAADAGLLGSEVSRLANAAGLRVESYGPTARRRDWYWEAIVVLNVKSSPAAVERFVQSVAEQPRFYKIDTSPPIESGRFTVRALTKPPTRMPEVQDDCSVPLPRPTFFPVVRELVMKVEVACKRSVELNVIRRPLRDVQAKERDVLELEYLLKHKGEPPGAERAPAPLRVSQTSRSGVLLATGAWLTDLLVTLAEWAPRIVACLLVVVLVALSLRLRSGPAGRLRLSTLGVAAGLLIATAAYLWQWRIFEARRAEARRARSSVQAEIAKADAEIATYRHGPVSLENYAPDLMTFEPAVPASDGDAPSWELEQWLVQAAMNIGLQAQSIQYVEKRSTYIERTITLKVEGTRASLERFAQFLAASSRLFRVEDLFLSAKAGTLRVSAFSDLRTKRGEREPCLAFPGDVDPAWFFSLQRERQELERACHRRRQLEHIVHDGYRRTRPLKELIERVRKEPLPPIDSEYVPARLESKTLQVRSVASEGRECAAIIETPDGTTLSLRAGDSLRDGVIVSCAPDHVIVKTEVSVSPGKTAARLLRFSPSQRLQPIAAAHGTTRITSPPLARMLDGVPRPFTDHAPDYYAWLERRNGAGVTPENNAAAVLDRALSGLKDAGQTFFDEMAYRGEMWRIVAQPWREQECPACALRLDANAKALADISQAVRRPRYFEGVSRGTRAADFRILKLMPMRHAANALAGRGMLRIARGDFKGASEDALAGQRLAVLASQEPMLIGKMLGVAVRGIVAPLLPLIAAQPAPSGRHALELLQQIERLPPLSSVADALDEYERFHELDQILFIRSIASARGPGAMVLQLEPPWQWRFGEPLQLDPVVYLIPPNLIDWEEALRITNRRFDAVVSLARAPDASERERARAEITTLSKQHEDRLRAVLGKLRGAGRETLQPGNVGRAAANLGATPTGKAELAELLVSNEPMIYQSNPGGHGIVWNECEALFRLTVNVLALAVQRQEKGEFPETFEAKPSPGYVLLYTRGSASTFAMIAAPEQAKVSGNRGFCTDATGLTRMTTDGTAPPVLNGLCDPSVQLLR